jgi:tetratricopeptide (TPR) repeat protein
VATCQSNLARLYNAQGRYGEAEPLYKNSLAIRENSLGPDAAAVAGSLEDYATLLRKTNRAVEAEELEKRARAIRSRQTSKSAPD